MAAMEFKPRSRHSHEIMTLPPPPTGRRWCVVGSAPNGNGVEPIQDSDDVEHPHIRRHRKSSANGSKIEIAIYVEAMIVVCHDIVIARKTLSS
jgi:hypothetical protein